MTIRRTRWLGHILALATVMVLAHMLTVWAIPRLIMERIITLGAGEAARQPTATGVFLPPPTDHTQRRIVMPSPDLLYATCAFDVSERPLRIMLDTGFDRYWSIALYASNSDNFFVVNDRDAPTGKVDLTLQGRSGAPPPQTSLPAGSQVVISPADRGFLLMRLLVNDDPAVLEAAETARRTLRCMS